MEEQGLSSEEAAKRLAKFGPNLAKKPAEVSFLAIAKEEITEPMILLLLVVGFFYTVWGKLEDAITIFVVIALLVFAEVWNEYRAKKAITALSKLAAPKTKVLRNGAVIEVGTEKIVPGDILILAPGTRVAADCRLLSSFSLQFDESTLTGESLSIGKKEGEEAYSGTLVVSGEGKAEALLTGAGTRMGKIAALAQEIKPPRTPLQLSMKSLTKTLVWVALFFSVSIPLLGLLRGNDLQTMLLTGLALAFATIPEELPIIITMILGLGSYKLSHEKFLVKKIKAAEVLGDATVILTDKTGTITENRMKVAAVFPADAEKAALAAALASLTELSISPTDRALAEKAQELGIAQESREILRERSFGNGRNTRSLLRKSKHGLELFVIGAPEEILAMARGRKDDFSKAIEREAAKGRRVLAVATKEVYAYEKEKAFGELEKGITIAGLISLEDPPRAGVKETVALARKAGIRTIIVTGDHPGTAAFIASEVGIPSEKVLLGDELDELSDAELQEAVKQVSVFARTTPEHKYRLVNALHKNGEVVAVTGDGVNDTLALKSADIGIAMGIKGTDAAKEAADAVLADDNFTTIGHAIFEGRKFYDNLRKGVKYYISVKVALVLVFLLPVLLSIAFPFAPIQIIVLELFMDLAASAGFVAEPAEKAIYTRPPRNPKEAFLNPLLGGIAVSGMCLFSAVTLTYGYALWQGVPLAQAQSMAFVAWMLGHILLAFVSRSGKEPLFSLGLLSNTLMNWWAAAVFGFLLLALLIPAIGTNLKLAPLAPGQLLLVIAISIVAIVPLEIAKVLSSRTGVEKAGRRVTRAS